MIVSVSPLAAKAGERSNWEILAFLRFFLALIVASTHLSIYSPNVVPFGWFPRLGAFEAILGFLLISGYSIGNSVQKEPRGFFSRRMWRIYPVYLSAIIVTYLVGRESLNASFFGTLLVNLLFLSQVIVSSSYVMVAWSLAVEVWLYALAPLFLRLRMRTLELLIVGSLVCYAFYTAGRTLFHWPYYSNTLFGLNLFCLAFIWIAGFYLSVSPSGPARPIRLIGALFLAHLLLTLCIQFFYRIKKHDLPSFLTLDVTDFIFHGMLLLLVYGLFWGIINHRFHLNFSARRICRFLGDISYPLYLVHLPTFILLSRYSHNAWIFLSAALLLSTVIYLGCDFYSRRRRLT